jgi:preprotein translocase subunit SecE
MRQIIDEIKKVTWPTRAETYKNTTVVIILSLIIGLYVGIIDFALAKLIAYIASK